MVKARVGIGATAVAVAAAGLLVAGVVVAATAGAATVCSPGTDCYQVAVGQASVPAGASQAFAITVTNESSRDTLGSVQVTAPTGFVITGTSGGSASYTAGSALFGNLGLRDGQSATLTIDATAPCTGAGTTWTIQPGESSQFTGTNGDDDGDAAQDFQASTLPVTVAGSCSLAFVTEPSDSAVGAPIMSLAGSGGSPVSVEVLAAGGTELATTSSAPISVTIGTNPNPSTATLSGPTSTGTVTVSASGGVASFPGISINQAGTDYTLSASSLATTSVAATSTEFSIYGEVQPCAGGGASCSATATNATTTGTVTTTSAPAGDFLGVGLGGVSLSCASSYQPLSDPLSFDVLSASGVPDSSALFTTTLQVAKSVVQSSGHTGASSWQICYASLQPFTAQAGTSGTTTIGGATYYTGLLADCSSSQPAPCVESRNKTGAGVEVVTFLAVGDPVARM